MMIPMGLYRWLSYAREAGYTPSVMLSHFGPITTLQRASARSIY